MYTIYNASTQNSFVFTKADKSAVSIPPGGSTTAPELTAALISAESAGLVVIKGSSEDDGISTSSVSQATNVTTGVTINAERGLITTQSASAAAGASHTFTVTNDNVTSSSNIQAYVVNYAGAFTTNGLPIVSVDNRTTGAFDIVISNAHGSNALSGALVIGFEIKS